MNYNKPLSGHSSASVPSCLVDICIVSIDFELDLGLEICRLGLGTGTETDLVDSGGIHDDHAAQTCPYLHLFIHRCKRTFK